MTNTEPAKDTSSKLCHKCGQAMVLRQLFTSSYLECPTCDTKTKTPESKLQELVNLAEKTPLGSVNTTVATEAYKKSWQGPPLQKTTELAPADFSLYAWERCGADYVTALGSFWQSYSVRVFTGPGDYLSDCGKLRILYEAKDDVAVYFV